MARVAAKNMGARTSLEYFRPKTKITTAAATSKLRKIGDPLTVIVFMVNFS